MAFVGIVKAVASAAGKIANGIGKARRAGKVAKLVKGKSSNWWKWLLAGAFMSLLVPVIAVEVLLGGVLSLKESFLGYFKKEEASYTEEYIAEHINDAGELYRIMSKSEYDPFEEGLIFIDKKTVLRILKRVDEYNKEVSKVHNVEYTYRVETGTSANMPTIDAYGNLGPVPDDPDPLVPVEVEVPIEEESTGTENSTEKPIEDKASNGEVNKTESVKGLLDGENQFTDISGNVGSVGSGTTNNGKPALPPVSEGEQGSSSQSGSEGGQKTQTIIVWVPLTDRIKYKSDTDEDDVDLVRKQIDIESQYTGAGEDIFYMRWQPVVALCCMYIQENFGNWGTYNNQWEIEESLRKDGNSDNDGGLLKSEMDEENYYLSNAEIDRIIDIYAYTYKCESDLTNKSWRNLKNILDSIFDKPLKFEEIKKGQSAYKIDISYDANADTGEITRITKYIPAIAPREIRNSYINYTYNYSELETGDFVLSERTITISPKSLVMKINGIIPYFSERLFLECLRRLPGAEDLVTYYGDMIFPGAESGLLISSSTTDPAVCPAIGTYVAEKDKTVGGTNGESNLIEGEWYINLYPSDGWDNNGVYLRPGEWLVREGNDYGDYLVTGPAITSLLQSDNVTQKQIEEFINDYPFGNAVRKNCPLFLDKQARKDLAQCLYDFQENTGASISGIFGIMIQEGCLKSELGNECWNFLSHTAGESWQYGVYYKNNHGFKDFKDKYETIGSEYDTLAVGAFEEQIYWIYNNYWNAGQDTYYKMVWNKTDTSNRETVYSGISHSYCPPWQDQAMPYSPESNTNGIYFWKNANEENQGWINRCGVYRESVLGFLQSTK